MYIVNKNIPVNIYTLYTCTCRPTLYIVVSLGKKGGGGHFDE